MPCRQSSHWAWIKIKKTVLIFGGSLGARTINEAVLANAKALLETQDVNIIWQVGNMYFQEYKSCILSGQKNVRIVPFIDFWKAVKAQCLYHF